jgi:Glycosyl transferase 4-like domain
MKRVLIVSPYFPPSTLAGVHRARHLAKHLPAAGWQPIVLCVHERFHEETIDPELATLLPRGLEIVKTRALQFQLTRPVGIGDLSLRAFYHLKSSISAILGTRSVDAVLITGAPYYPMLLSGWLKRRYGKPVILDFQDPWVSAYGAAQPRFSKGGLAHWLATQLEPRTLRSADFVTSVSDGQNGEMALRYSWLDAGKMAAIPIGGDPDDYLALRTRGGRRPLDPGYIHFSYVGTFLPRSAATARILFAAIAELRQATPELAARLRFNFVGTSNQPDNKTSYRFRPLAEAAGVGDLVVETPQRIPYLDALDVLASSNVVLLLGSDEPHYTASKIYPGLMSGRPYLSLFHSASSAHRILEEAGGGRALSFAGPEELEAMKPRLVAAIRDLATAPDAAGKAHQEAITQYSARAVAGRFADIFDAVVSQRPLTCTLP